MPTKTMEMDTIKQVKKATPHPNGVEKKADSYDLTIDVDLITIDAFLEMMEIQERIKDAPSAKDMRALYNILSVAVVDMPPSLPYRYLYTIMQQVTAAFSAGMDPN